MIAETDTSNDVWQSKSIKFSTKTTCCDMCTYEH